MPDKKPTNPKDAIGGKKLQFSAIPWGSVIGIAAAMVEGALKYGRHNYRHTMEGAAESDGPADGDSVRASIYFDASLRHIVSWWEGEDIDPDSALLHIDKAQASLSVLRDAVINGTLYDDRPPKSLVPQLIRDMSAATARMIDEFPTSPRKPWVHQETAK